jgi:large subunit ribosomal protein L7/L12
MRLPFLAVLAVATAAFADEPLNLKIGGERVLKLPGIEATDVSDPNVIEVRTLSEGSFVVRAIAGGTARVTVTAAGKKTEYAVKVEAPREVSVILLFTGPNKISVIKEVRTVTGLGLKEAKDLVEAAPKVVREKLDPAEAARIGALLTAAGATVEIK